MPSQVVNDQLVDLLRPFFWAKDDALPAGCPWKLCSPDGLIDPVVYTDNGGDTYVNNWLYAIPGVSTTWIDGNGNTLGINDCYEVVFDCVSAGEHAHVGFSVMNRLFFYGDEAVNSAGWTTLDNIGDRQTGMYIVNGVSDNDTADSRFQAIVYYSECGGGITSAIEYKVGAANAQLQVAGVALQCQALNVNLNRVSTIGIETFHV